MDIVKEMDEDVMEDMMDKMLEMEDKLYGDDN